VLGTKAIPYVTPSMLFVCDLNNTPGSYMEIRVDGAIPLYREIFQLQPYALLGLNLGYNTTAYYGWNNFQFGLKAICKINRFISIFGGINYSVAMTALKRIDQGNQVWASASGKSGVGERRGDLRLLITWSLIERRSDFFCFFDPLRLVVFSVRTPALSAL
jgi:hypothetical protein